MVKPKLKRNPVVGDPLEDLIDSLKDAELSVGSERSAVQEEIKPAEVGPEVDIDAVRGELIKSSEDGEIDQSVKYLKKASAKVVEKIHKQVERKRLEKASAFITDMLLSRFADMLGGLDAVASSEELNNDLQKDGLLKRDVEKIVGYATPFLPFLGLISGGLTTGKHVYKHTSSSEGALVDPLEGPLGVQVEPSDVV